MVSCESLLVLVSCDPIYPTIRSQMILSSVLLYRMLPALQSIACRWLHAQLKVAALMELGDSNKFDARPTRNFRLEGHHWRRRDVSGSFWRVYTSSCPNVINSSLPAEVRSNRPCQVCKVNRRVDNVCHGRKRIREHYNGARRHTRRLLLSSCLVLMTYLSPRENQGASDRQCLGFAQVCNISRHTLSQHAFQVTKTFKQTFMTLAVHLTVICCALVLALVA